MKVDTARAVRTWCVDIICRTRIRQSLVRCLPRLRYECFVRTWHADHNFYRPLLARQWIHVCVSLRRLLEYLTCRARRRHLQWYLLAGFAGDDTPRAVFFDVDARGDSTGAVLGQGIALAVEAHGDSTGAVLGQGDMLVWSFWSARPGRVPAGCRVRQNDHGSDSADSVEVPQCAVPARWWTSLCSCSDVIQLSVLTAEMRCRFFGALYTGTGLGVVSTGTRPP